MTDIDGVDPSGGVYSVKALVIEGECPAIEALLEMERREACDLRNGIRIVASVRRSEVHHCKRVSADRLERGVYEIANRGGGHGRMFCFYLEAEGRAVVCLGAFWKTGEKKRSRARQEHAFDEAAERMEDYLKWRQGRESG